MSRFQDLTLSTDRLVEAGRFAGISTLVWRAGEIVHLHQAGWRDLAARAELRRDTIFRIASMTKPVISAAALALVEDGRMALGDPISRWLPEAETLDVLRTPGAELDDVVPLERPPSLHDLLTHTAGFAWTTGLDAPISRAMADAVGQTPSIPHDPDTLARRVCALPLLQQPGRGWCYSISTDLLGVVIARASGMSLPDLLRSRIFQPLGMADTGFHVPPEKLERLSVGYQREASGRLEVHDPAQGGFWSRPPVFPAGGGGLVSTLDDYLVFARMLLAGGGGDCVRILSKASAALMTGDRLTAPQRQPLRPSLDYLHGQGFGYGVSVALGAQEDRRRPGSYGWPGAYSTAWFADPDEDLIALAMGQLWLDPQNELRALLETQVYAALGG